MNNKNVLSWFDNNSIFSCIDEYNNFMEYVKQRKVNDDLPVIIQHQNAKKLSLYDIKEFCNRVRANVGLETDFRFTTCDCCNDLQCLIIIDKPTEEEIVKN